MRYGKTQKAVLAWLAEHGAGTAEEIAAALCTNEKNVRSAVYGIRNGAPGVLRVAKWLRQERHGGEPTPVWEASASRDAPRPKPATPGQRQRRYYARNAESEKLRQKLARARAAAAVRPATWLTGLA